MAELTDLAVEAVVPTVLDALVARGRAVLTSPPGSGKTTVVPLRILEAGLPREGKILVLEPRRLATRAAARRMAHLLNEAVGETVGYVTRDDRRTGPATKIEVVTEGILTRRLQRNPELPGVGLVIFDEVHERNLQTDLGLALALSATDLFRPDLWIMAMSATIDTARFAHLLGTESNPAPVVEAQTRSFPVDIIWRPPPRNARLENHVAAVVRSALGATSGDLLVFLPGMAEIKRVAALLPDLEADVRLLHGSLPAADQDAALAPGMRRKIVLATDIAETSLTVEGVRVVVDCGLAKAPRFDARTGMTRLRTLSISKASADQRSGRAGRTEPGVAYRLWSTVEHAARKSFIEPEITEVDMAGVALELAAWGVEDTSELKFLDLPPRRTWEESLQLLTSLGALSESHRLTATGKALAELPLHPRLARMVVDARDDQWLACLLAALIDERDIIRGRPQEVPTDLAVRVRMLNEDTGSFRWVRRRAQDLGRRIGASEGAVNLDQVGSVLALAFPDRLAVKRGSAGRFQLRTGTTAWVPATDSLAEEQFLVVADLDGKRKDARIRLAAAIDADEVSERFAHALETSVELTWNDDRLVERVEERLGGMRLKSTQRRPEPGPQVVTRLLERLRVRELADLHWTKAARQLRERVAFLHRSLGDPWPDWSIGTLAATSHNWLAPYLDRCTGLDDLAQLEVLNMLRGQLDPRLFSELERLAPKELTIPSGRKIPLDYSTDQPSVEVRVQEIFGVAETPRVGGMPIVLRLLSPAGRPVQITSDLAGFWDGTWKEVRREMAGRYPKHSWPEDPRSVAPERP